VCVCVRAQICANRCPYVQLKFAGDCDELLALHSTGYKQKGSKAATKSQNLRTQALLLPEPNIQATMVDSILTTRQPSPSKHRFLIPEIEASTHPKNRATLASASSPGIFSFSTTVYAPTETLHLA